MLYLAVPFHLEGESLARNLTFSLNIGRRTLLKDFGIRPEHILRKARLPEDLF